jgi:hypothetical protein
MKSLMTFITTAYTNYWVRVALLTIYYFAIIVGLVLMYGKGNFEPAEFIYQGY